MVLILKCDECGTASRFSSAVCLPLSDRSALWLFGDDETARQPCVLHHLVSQKLHTVAMVTVSLQLLLQGMGRINTTTRLPSESASFQSGATPDGPSSSPSGRTKI